MLDVLVGIYPASTTRDGLALEAAMSLTSGTFGTYLSMLKGNGLIEVTGADIKANDDLFAQPNKK